MDSSKVSALLFILMLFISTTPPILACGQCNRHPKALRHHKPPYPHPPVVLILPPTVPRNPPVTGTPPAVPCPSLPVPSPGAATCPVEALKIGACVDVLVGVVNGVIGNPVVNKCCPVLLGLLELEAATCLCTIIRRRLLDINIYLPLALKLLITCGKTPPPGFNCTV